MTGKAEIEQKLRSLGARRQRHSNEGEAIQGAISKAVAEAKGVISMERVAELLRMHRSSLYGRYVKGDNGRTGSKEAGSREGNEGANGTGSTEERSDSGDTKRNGDHS